MLSVILPNHNEPNIHEVAADVEKRFPGCQIVIANDTRSRGKGWAIRQGLTACKGDQIAFLDGDGEIPPRMLLRMLPFLEDYDVVVGSKKITHAPLRRQVMTRVTRIWFKFLFGVKVDTQTGIKVFRRSALESLKYCWRSDGFIFDVEVLSTLQQKGAKMIEVPIECEIRRQLAFKTIYKMTLGSIWLWFRLLFRVKK